MELSHNKFIHTKQAAQQQRVRIVPKHRQTMLGQHLVYSRAVDQIKPVNLRQLGFQQIGNRRARLVGWENRHGFCNQSRRNELAAKNYQDNYPKFHLLYQFGKYAFD
ncbi:MAG: hypothetical protein R3C05_12020 [Pirellulaceae bacterium]